MALVKIIRLILSSISISSFAIVLTLMVFLYWPFQHPYIPATPNIDTAKVENGYIFIQRHYVITKRFTGTVYRELLQKGTSYVTKWELPSAIIDFVPGSDTRGRGVAVHDIPPGDYELINTICYEINFLRRQCLHLPVINLTVEVSK